VAIFYAALHYVSAYLATRGQHPGDHKAMRNWIAWLRELKGLEIAYENLYVASIDARYRGAGFGPADVKAGWDDLARIKRTLATLGVP
jgi:hypothetical protein